VGEIARRASRQVEALAEDGARTTAFSGVVIGLRWADRLDEAEQVLDRSLPIARRRGSMIDLASCTGLRAEVYVRRGMLREAEAEARAAQAVDIERTWWFARGLNPLLQSLVAQGRTSDALEVMNAELGDEVLPDVPPMLSLMLTRVRVRAGVGDHVGALAEFEQAVRRRDKWGGLNPSWVSDLLIAADSHLALGDVASARQLREQAHALAVRWGTPGALGQVARAEGVAQKGEDGIARVREAISLLEQSPARLELARALVDLGSALRRGGNRSDSREPLQVGYDLARQCGAAALAENARYQLAASGVRIRRERLTGADALTPSERRIVEIAAGGGTNAQIAQTLFVTVKTVEMHLTNAYRKLGISGRSELHAALRP
jgi:DNA-binding CsgD family transcriptional regulator